MSESVTSTPSVAPLRRAVLWLGVIAWLFAAGCALGVFFGIPYYNYESARPPSRFQALAVRLALVGIVEKGVLAVAFALVGRALLGYAGALNRDPGAATVGLQARCWRGVIWLALLYAAGELALAVVSATG